MPFPGLLGEGRGNSYFLYFEVEKIYVLYPGHIVFVQN